ncbi:MAG: hypothetical protein N4A57_06830 [Anaeromicrobium sp.]|jgi:hypothetical protein|uniref:hypothetical protein n=1 Tax=Anaeromicrobium sp. TaxID=1929132 RepID=UPI0025D317EA|nr:hypothetical protein [Anaeromicrobium sp.]MCT4593969.1 hypothetical protein [Anaeromicrobium sp.]
MYNSLLKLIKMIFKNKHYFEISKEIQMEYLNKISKKLIREDFVMRSFLQYKCQTFKQPRIKMFILNVVCTLAILPTIMVLFISYKYHKNKLNISEKKYENIAINFGYYDKIPSMLVKKYKIKEMYKKYILTYEDIRFLFKRIISKHPFNGYFIMKNIIKIALYSYNVTLQNPEAILVNCEYSFTSSILTLYCNFKGIKHINFMHGEKLLIVRDSFVKFDEFYIWDEYYKNIFKKLKADEKQFIVNLPENLEKYKCGEYSETKTLTYYLQGDETHQQLNLIKNKLQQIKDRKHLNIRIRPHPRYGDRNVVSKVLKDFNIEYDKNIIDSLKEAEFIVSKYSTVIFEGYLMNKKIVIDDISNKKFYGKLKDLDYIILNKKHIKLSEVI